MLQSLLSSWTRSEMDSFCSPRSCLSLCSPFSVSPLLFFLIHFHFILPLCIFSSFLLHTHVFSYLMPYRIPCFLFLLSLNSPILFPLHPLIHFLCSSPLPLISSFLYFANFLVFLVKVCNAVSRTDCLITASCDQHTVQDLQHC